MVSYHGYIKQGYETMPGTGLTMIGRARTIVSSSSIHAAEPPFCRESGEFNSRSFSWKLNVYLMQLRAPSLIV